MLIASLFTALLLGSAVQAQSSTTQSAPGATHTVSVGADGLNFSPREIGSVPVGDIIEFRFYPLNHSVARAAFGPETPCIPYELTKAGRVGFWSGFQPTKLVTNTPPIFRLPINDTEPVFFYCSAPDACLQGMIGVINPNSTFTFDLQFKYTQNATVQFSPLEYFPVEGPITRTTTATGAATTVPSTSSTSVAAAATTTAAVAPTPGSSSSSLGTGPIVGIAIGGFAVVLLAGALLYMCGRQKTVTEILNRQSMAPSNHNSYMPSAAGMSEAQYPNKTPATMNDGRFSGYGPAGETESYRSMSPPADERTGFMPMQQQMHMNQHGLGVISPPGSPGYPSPTYYESHEMDNAQNSTGLSPYQPPPPQPAPVDQGPHEMAVPSRNPSAAAVPQNARPFSYIDSESDFTANSRNRGEAKGENDSY